MSSDYFTFHLRRPTRLARSTAGPVVAAKPQIAVAKKLLPRAVDRNLVKRIAREVWREAPPMAGTVLIRLKRRPQVWLDSSVRRRKQFVRHQVQALLARSVRPSAGRNQP